MEETKEEISRQDVAGVFDEILGRHMERLLGSRFGIAGLSLNLGTVACLLLLADQVGGAGQDTLGTMIDRLTEIGVDGAEEVETLLRDMLEKGYILEDGENKITAGKPAVSMAQVLERLFPKMPGMNLIAYTVQTIDEVTTGRKALEAALVQFDQTLKMQGVPLRQKHGSTAQASPQVLAPTPHPPRPQENVQTRLPKVAGPFETTSEGQGGIRIIGSSTDSLHWEPRDAELLSVPSPEALSALSQRSEEEPQQGPESCDPEAEARSVPVQTEDAASSLSETLMELPPENPPDVAEATEHISSPGLTGQEPPSPLEGRQEDEEMPPAECAESQGEDFAAAPPEEMTDDLIEREVSRFEEELSAQCPLCQKGKVQSQKTGTGKVYYKCENRECSFISWGKPYHMSCPRCGNPFLIEVPDGQGSQVIRCPRATCKYRQTGVTEVGDKPTLMQGPASATPRRRVVRRRVVRRKR